MLVVAHVRALGDVTLLSGLPVEVARFLRVRERMAGRILDFVDPVSRCEDVVRLQVVRLPQSARVCRDRRAPEFDAVPDRPRRHRDGRRRDQHDARDPCAEAESPDDVGGERERHEDEP